MIMKESKLILIKKMACLVFNKLQVLNRSHQHISKRGQSNILICSSKQSNKLNKNFGRSNYYTTFLTIVYTLQTRDVTSNSHTMFKVYPSFSFINRGAPTKPKEFKDMLSILTTFAHTIEHFELEFKYFFK